MKATRSILLFAMVVIGSTAAAFAHLDEGLVAPLMPPAMDGQP